MRNFIGKNDHKRRVSWDLLGSTRPRSLKANWPFEPSQLKTENRTSTLNDVNFNRKIRLRVRAAYYLTWVLATWRHREASSHNEASYLKTHITQLSAYCNGGTTSLP